MQSRTSSAKKTPGLAGLGGGERASRSVLTPIITPIAVVSSPSFSDRISIVEALQREDRARLDQLEARVRSWEALMFASRDIENILARLQTTQNEYAADELRRSLSSKLDAHQAAWDKLERSLVW